MTKNTDFETVGAMHQCKKGEMFSTCAHCGAMAGKLNSPCPQYMRNAAAAMTKAAPVAPTPQPVPEALRLAEMLTADEWPGSVTIVSYARECVAELRRLHAENERLAAAPKAAPPAPLQQGEYPETLYEGGRESVDDALAVVESFGPGVQGLNDTFARQVLLGQEVRRLRAAYEHACQGRSDFRNLYRAARGAAQAAPAGQEVWTYRRYGSESEKGYTIIAKAANATRGTPVAYLGDGDLAAKAVDAICDAHNATQPQQAAPAPVAEDVEIRKALDDAATSLETISSIAGRDKDMLGMMDVRLYAAARARVAREAQAAQPEGGAKP